jgi:hypothetical protein
VISPTTAADGAMFLIASDSHLWWFKTATLKRVYTADVRFQNMSQVWNYI